MAKTQFTRTLIERAALKLFVRDGVNRTTTRRIAETAGVSEGAIYRHFVSKDELAKSLFARIHGQLRELIHRVQSFKNTIDDKARAIVEAYCEVADEDWLLFAYHLRAQHGFLPFDDVAANPVEIIEQIVRQAMNDGEIPKGDAQLIAGMALGVVLQPALHKAYGRIDGPLSAHTDQFTAAVLHILKTSTPKISPSKISPTEV